MELELLEQPPPRGTFAKLQPLSSAFAATVDDPKRALESALLFRFSTLSVGDAVSFAGDDGAVHELFVVELRPADTVLLVDTELEGQRHE